MDFNYDSSTISSVLVLDPGANSLSIAGTTGLVLPSGTTAQRAASLGVVRVNTDTSTLEWYNGAGWVTVGAQSGNLASIAALNGTGFLTQTATATFVERAFAGTAGRITVTNGDGVAGSPTFDLATAGTAGTYVSTTTDAYGRVTAGSTTQAWGTLTGTPTTVAGYGITNAVVNLGGAPSISANTLALRPAASTAGRLFVSTDTLALYYDTGAAWSLVRPATTGDVTSPLGGTVNTLATVNSNVGTFGSTTVVPVVTVNAKGLVTAVSTASISGAINVTGGDLTMSGATGTAITNATLATVNANVGSFGSTSSAPVITVNAKGLVTAVSTAAITPNSIGAINVNQLGVANGVATLDATGKLTDTQIPAALVGALVYQGVWNASTNTPTITSGVGTKGQYYKVSVAGSTTVDGNNTWQVGDQITFNGTTWDGIDGLTSEVTTVFGRVGAVTASLASADFANQGSTTTFLKGNAAGNPSWSAVSLTTDVTGVLQAAQSPAYTGDITKPAGSFATTLATVNSNTGSFGSATAVPVVTVNAKGLVTAVTTATIPNTVALTGDGTASVTTGGSGALTLATVNSNVGSFGSSTLVPVITVNAKGLITAVSTSAISGAISVTGGDLTLSGTTGTAITNATLATVNSNVGTFGSATQIPVFAVNAKGLVTAVTNTSITPANIGAVANAGTAPSIQSGTFAAMPAAAIAGRLYVTSDTNSIYRDSGTAWVQVSEATLLYTENAVSPVASTVTGANASSIGSGNTAAGTAVFATGVGASSSVYGAEVRANGSFSVAGDAQSGKYVLRNSTTNATVTEVFADGTAARIVLPNNSSVTYSAQVVAQRTDATGGHGAWEIKGLISRDATAASTALVGNRSKTVLTKPAGWDVEVSADVTNGALAFKVTGVAAQTIRWVVTVTTTETRV